MKKLQGKIISIFCVLVMVTTGLSTVVGIPGDFDGDVLTDDEEINTNPIDNYESNEINDQSGDGLELEYRNSRPDISYPSFTDENYIPNSPKQFPILPNNYFNGEFPIDPDTGLVEVIIKLYGLSLSEYTKENQNMINQNDYISYKQKLKKEQLDVKTKLTELGINIQYGSDFITVINGFSATVNKNDIDILKTLPYIRDISPNHKVDLLLQDTVPLINVDDVWADPGVTGSGIEIGIIDTGIDYMHPDLGEGFGPGYKVFGGYDIIMDDDIPEDLHGHGTHVAGIIAGTGQASSGLYKGVAPDALLYIAKVFHPGEDTYDSHVQTAIQKCMDPNGDSNYDDAVDIISMSLGGSGHPDDDVSRTVDWAVSLGTVVVVSSGNSGDYGTVLSPGCAREALTVGASTHIVDSEDSGGPDKIAWYSSRGPSMFYTNPTTYGLKPDVLAPGGDVSLIGSAYRHGVVSARADGTSMGNPVNDFYTRASGTSMAAPHISGVAALLLEESSDFTPSQVKSAIMNTGIDLGYNVFTQGGGRVDALKAVKTPLIANPSSISFNIITESSNSDIVFRNVGPNTINDVSVSANCYKFAEWPSGDILDPSEEHNDYVELSYTPPPNSINLGETFTANLFVNIPSDAIDGWYGGVVIIEDTNDIHLEVPYFFIITFDVKVTSSDPYKYMQISDTQIEFPVNVENIGGFDHTYDLIADLPVGLSAEILDSSSNPITEIFLSVGENEDFTLRITTTSSMSKYLQEVKFIARSQTNPDVSDFVDLRFVKPDEIINGDWVIDIDTVINDWTILLNGNLLILEGFSLTFNNVGLVFNTQSNGQYSLMVGGTFDHNAAFVVDVSDITVLNPHNTFKFEVNGGIDLENSKVSYLWGEIGQIGGIQIMHDTIHGNPSQIVNSKITHSQTYGIYLQPRPSPPWTNSPLIQGNEISNNGLSGIHLWQVNRATISQNNIFDNGWETGGNPGVRNSRAGIQVLESSPTITENVIENNILIGIYITHSESSPLIINNEISNNYDEEGFGDGIMIDDALSLTISNNLISDEGIGINIDECGNPIIDGNQITFCTIGIFGYDSYPTIRNNVINRNLLWGVSIQSSNSGDPIEITENVITESGIEVEIGYIAPWSDNINIVQSSNVLIENNDLSHALSHNGLTISHCTDVTISTNLFNTNKRAGLFLWGGGSYDVRDNTFLNNGDLNFGGHRTGGIVVWEGVTNCELRYNRFESNNKYGIYSDGNQIVDAKYNYFGKWQPELGQWQRGGPNYDISDSVYYDPWIWGGTIDEDVIWYTSDSPYIVGDDLAVADGVTLTIEPDVEVKFTGDYAADIRDQKYDLKIFGNLIADGSSNRITFTRDDRVTPWVPTQWGGIELTQTDSPTNVFSWDVSYADIGLKVIYSQANIDSCTIQNTDSHGIYLTSSPDNEIRQTTISDVGSNGIHIQRSADIMIDNCDISNGNNGIHVTEDSPNLQITDSDIMNMNIDGISIGDNSDGSIITRNTIQNTLNGLCIDSSRDIIIQENTLVAGGGYGMNIQGCYNAIISMNNIIEGFNVGVFFDSLTFMEDNTINNNNIGIDVDNSESVITSNTISNNILHGINAMWSSPIIELNTFIGNGLASFEEDGGALYFWGSSSPVTNNLITSNKNGIYGESSNCIVVQNTIDLNNVGIFSDDSQLIIQANNFFDNEIGIYSNQDWDSYTDNPVILMNTILNSKFYGIYCQGSSPTILKNTIEHNGFYLPQNDYGGICIDRASPTIDGNIINDNYNGIYSRLSPFTFVFGNIISNNLRDGIWAEQSTLEIAENTIKGNQIGVALSWCSNTVIHHNNFISNTGNMDSGGTNNRWYTEFGGDYAGNYWDDYTYHIYGGNSAVDDFDGLKFSLGDPQTGGGGSDDVWDWSYDDNNVEDWYPFIGTYKLAVSVQLYEGWNLISLPLEQEDTTLEVVLQSIDPYYDQVQYYDASDASDPWKDWNRDKPPEMNDLTDLNHEMGFWIKISGVSKIKLIVYGLDFSENYGSQGFVPVQLSMNAGGWNMVGYASNKENVLRDDGLNNLIYGTHVQAIMLYDTELGIERQMESWETFEIGRGYWFVMIDLPTPEQWEVLIDP